MAIGTMVALTRRATEGGDWLVRITVAQVDKWLFDRGTDSGVGPQGVIKEFTPAELDRWSMVSNTPVGRLQHLAPVLRTSETPPRWNKPMVPLGYHKPGWPA